VAGNRHCRFQTASYTAASQSFASPLGVERLIDLRNLVDVDECGRSVGKQSLEHVEVSLRHDSIGESRVEFLPTPAAADFRQARDAIHHLGSRLTGEIPLPRRTQPEGVSLDDARSTAHRRPGLVHHQTERLRPDSATFRSVFAVGKNRRRGC